MKRINFWVTEDQAEFLTEWAKATGKTQSDYVRSALDHYKAATGYIDEMDEIAAEVHPWMTYEQFVGWLQFRYRLTYEGKDHKNGNGNGQVIALLEEILTILKGGQHDTDHG
jgi:predicted DNA-binding protein